MKKEQGLLKSQYMRDRVEKLSIDTALQQNWTIPHRKIQVKVSANNVTLSGKVHTKHARNEAGRIAMQAPGVLSVDNKILLIETSDLPYAH